MPGGKSVHPEQTAKQSSWNKQFSKYCLEPIRPHINHLHLTWNQFNINHIRSSTSHIVLHTLRAMPPRKDEDAAASEAIKTLCILMATATEFSPDFDAAAAEIGIAQPRNV